MDKPAARIGDKHTCPMVEAGKPHVGGPIVGPGAPTVFAQNMPVSVKGDSVTCSGAPDTVLVASTTVFACDKNVARMGDNTAHGGVIVGGAPLVLVGDPGSPPEVSRLEQANEPFCEICEKEEASSEGQE